jgi:hypothetical protein
MLEQTLVAFSVSPETREKGVARAKRREFFAEPLFSPLKFLPFLLALFLSSRLRCRGDQKTRASALVVFVLAALSRFGSPFSLEEGHDGFLFSPVFFG